MSTPTTLAESVARQRDALANLLREPLALAAQACSRAWPSRAGLNAALTHALSTMPACKYLYALDTRAIQLSDNISREGLIETDYGRDRSDRPYMREAVPNQGFLLTQAYISLRAKRPSLTAIQIVRDDDGQVLGFVGADFDLRDLPITGKLYDEPTYWRQIKGDPAIRSAVFHQTRSDSQMDLNLDTVLGVMEELMTDRGVFHGKLHFSSSRATIWLVDDPYRYRLLDIDALTDPNTCLVYPAPRLPGRRRGAARQDPPGARRPARAALHGRDVLPARRLAQHLQRHGRPHLLVRRLALPAVGRIPQQRLRFLGQRQGARLTGISLGRVPLTAIA